MRFLVLCAFTFCLICQNASGQSYALRVHLKTGETVSIPIDDIRHVVFSQTTGVREGPTAEQAPLAFRLLQNYPNPFNPSTTLVYETATTSDVSVRIFDLKGALIRDLLHEVQGAGRYLVSWDGTDNTRAHVSSGAYFCVVQSGGQVLSRRLLLLK